MPQPAAAAATVPKILITMRLLSRVLISLCRAKYSTGSSKAQAASAIAWKNEWDDSLMCFLGASRANRLDLGGDQPATYGLKVSLNKGSLTEDRGTTSTSPPVDPNEGE
jgi:hypothetical protein